MLLLLQNCKISLMLLQLLLTVVQISTAFFVP
jgi:hypothetical protein